MTWHNLTDETGSGSNGLARITIYLGSILVGICYGVRLTITPAAASELFGLKYYGLLYNILILNLPLLGIFMMLKQLVCLEGETLALGHIVTCLCM